jgi:hypothetical protein
VDSLAKILRPYRVLVRMKCSGDPDPSPRGGPLFSPVLGYLVGCCGPVSTRDIEWIEVQSVEHKSIGRLVPDKQIDHSDAIGEVFTERGFKFTLHHGIFRIDAA